MVVEVLLRAGAIPLLCSGATCCFAIYGTKVRAAATQWRALPSVDCVAHADELDMHAGGAAVLTLSSAVATAEALLDYRAYRSGLSQEALAALLTRAPFFVRSSVLCSAVAAAVASTALTGGVRLLAPQRPAILLPQGTSARAASSPETSAAASSLATSARAAGGGVSSSLEAAAPQERASHPPAQKAALDDQSCDALARRLAACERSNTARTRFHCDPQRDRLRASCGDHVLALRATESS